MKPSDRTFTPEPERCELFEPVPYRFKVTRRAFIQVVGAGLWISVTGGVALAQRGRDSESETLTARLFIGDDGTVTVMTSKVEIGQGARTQLAMAAAEELRLPLDRVRMLMADTAVVPDDGGTYGSRTTPANVPDIRRAAAYVRTLLTEGIAERWDVPASEIEVRDGAFTHKAGGHRITYAEIARDESLAEIFERRIPSDVPLTPVSEWKVLGTSPPPVAARDIVTGAHAYPSDIRRPGMLYGKVLRPPSYGATLESVDLAPAEAMEGVVAVRDGDFVGVVAPTSFRAARARDAVAETAKWTPAPHPSSRELFDHLKRHRAGDGRENAEGSVEDGLKTARERVRAEYHVPYIQHAPMEPRAAVAEWDGDSLTVWTGSQVPSRVHDQLVEAFSLPPDRVRVIIPDTGGGFGGKHTGECAIEAARLARAAEKPVSLQWTRDEEFTWAYFRPAGVIEIEAGLDADGRITAWNFINIASGAAGIGCPYDVPNKSTRFERSDSPLRTGSYRALAATANNFARECFIDELAARAGADPLEFRLRHLAEGRLRDVLLAAAERFAWTEQARAGGGGEGRGIGIACGTEKGSFVAACAEVEVDRNAGRLRVLRLVEAFECGAVQNPRNLEAQISGCVVMGLGGALTEEVVFEDGRIRTAGFRDYRVPRFKDVPPLDIVILNRPDLPSVGAGETPIIPVAPAIGNAVYHAVGVRLRRLPLRGEALREAPNT